jgi:hypothetical protein
LSSSASSLAHGGGWKSSIIFQITARTRENVGDGTSSTATGDRRVVG